MPSQKSRNERAKRDSEEDLQLSEVSEEEEESPVQSRRKRRQKNPAVGFFIDEEVEVDDEEDEDDVDYDPDASVEMSAGERRAAETVIQQRDQQTLTRPSYRDKFAKMSVDDMIAYFNQRSVQEGDYADEEELDQEDDYYDDEYSQYSQDEVRTKKFKFDASQFSREFIIGDAVEVLDGELKNMHGKVIRVERDSVFVLPNHPELKEPIKFSNDELRKYFVLGDHVKITAGPHENKSGTIVRINEDQVIVLSDLNMDELTTCTTDLRLDISVSAGITELPHLHFHDLVDIDSETVGVIIRMDKESVSVLDMNGFVIQAEPSSLQPRKNTKFGRAFDAAGNTIQVGDNVTLTDTSQTIFENNEENKTGEVKYIFRANVFVYSRRYRKDTGIFVVRNKMLTLTSALTRVPAPSNTDQPINNFNNQNSGFNSRQQGQRRDTSIIGKTVRILQGPMKSYFGIVKDVTVSNVRVELHAQPRIITLDRAQVSVVEGDAVSRMRQTEVPYFAVPCTSTRESFSPSAFAPVYGHGAQTPNIDTQDCSQYY